MFPERPVGDTVDEPLGRVDRLGHVLRPPQSIPRDAAPHIYDRSQVRLAAHDVGVPARVRSRCDTLDDLEDVGPAAYPLELVDASKLVCERELIYGLASRLLFYNDTANTEIYTLSLHDALPI